MARGKTAPTKARAASVKLEVLEAFMRSGAAARLLGDPNVSSVGIGHKITNGRRTKELAIQVTVNRKLPTTQLEAAGTSSIPTAIEFEGVQLPTDVIERSFRPSYTEVAPEQKADRKRRLDPMRPGASVSHPSGTAGTLGAFVYDIQSGAPCILSNWHVLNTPSGSIGDRVVQPGPFDDSRIDQNGAGVLLKSHLGLAGDCAVARVEGRGFDPRVLELGVTVTGLAKVELGDRVVKSGRTTGVTNGIVRRTDVITKIEYGNPTGERQIGGFEIGPDDGHPAPRRQISEGGDSGSVWFIADENGSANGLMAGLHFAGEGRGDPDDHALACYAQGVFEKLEISLQAPQAPATSEGVSGQGYVAQFLGVPVPMPVATPAGDVYELEGRTTIPYTHFSVCLSRSRRMCRFVAWNIDGAQLKKYGRKGLNFVFDPRIDEDAQTGNDVYVDNKLDRGHIARRADLVWGPEAEATRANKDSFYYTNITPQHQAFNQSERAGLWGELENAIYEDGEVEELKLSVMGGPIFKSSDMKYRGIRIPAAFWKALFFKEGGRLRAKAYVLTQDDLLNDIEALELDEFRLYQVSLAEVERRAKLSFAPELKAADVEPSPEALGVSGRYVREVLSRAALIR